MPFKVQKHPDCPAGKPWGVVNTDNGDLGGRCHPTKKAARQQQKALYVNVPDAKAMAEQNAGEAATAISRTETWLRSGAGFGDY